MMMNTLPLSCAGLRVARAACTSRPVKAAYLSTLYCLTHQHRGPRIPAVVAYATLSLRCEPQGRPTPQQHRKDADLLLVHGTPGGSRQLTCHPDLYRATLLSSVAFLVSGFLLLVPGDAEAMSISALADAAVEAVASSGWLAPAVFVALYAAATVLLFPASVLTLAAGALFGPLAGTALVSLASTVGATAAFVVSRYFARPWVERKIAGLPRFKAVLAGVAARGAYVVFLLRLSPLVPFNLLNYALGLTSVRVLPYVLSSWVGMLPGTFAYVYLGGAGKAAVSAAAGDGAAMDTTQLVLYGVGAVATILATRAISGAATKALEDEQTEGGAGAGNGRGGGGEGGAEATKRS